MKKFIIKEWQDKYLTEAYDYKSDPELEPEEIEIIDAADDIHPKDFKKFRGEWDDDEWGVLRKHGYEFVNMDKNIGQYFESNGAGEFDNSGSGFTGSHFVYDDDDRFVVHQVGELKTGKNPYLFLVDAGSGNVLLSAKANQFKKVVEFLKKKYKLS